MIRVLDDLTINKIAAGEVVEGPFSVVKELIENSIDAGASTITLEIKDGGKKYLRVTDNGVGIPEVEVEKAFLRHATSKITKLEDLEVSFSLGFRGEALASIAAVSQLELITKPVNQEYGISIELAGGRIVSHKKVGCPTGTTIIVRNLFFNTPVRQKFMKSTQGETLRITEIITRLSLSKPEIAFRYINNNSIMLSSNGSGEISKTIISILDKDIFKSLIPINHRVGEINLSGYVGEPILARGNRNYEMTYINGRYIKNPLIFSAIEEAYKEKLPINKFPLCVLYLQLPPSYIDVNVHPTKTEVKFKDEEEIYQTVLEGIEGALKKKLTIPTLSVERALIGKNNKVEVSYNIHDEPSKTVELPDDKTNPITQELTRESLENYNANTVVEEIEVQLPLFADIKKDLSKEAEENPSVNSFRRTEEVIVQHDFLSSLLLDFKIIGQLFNTYILLEGEASLYLIDQHAAHERLLYQRLMEEYKNQAITSQNLIDNQVLQLIAEDYQIIMDNIDYFTSLGFEIEAFGQNTIIIRSVPIVLGKPSSFDFIIEILDEIKNGRLEERSVMESIIKKSCRQAIKASDRLDYLEIKELLYQLSVMEGPLTCPHGRPIVLTLSKSEIEKYFKRIQ